MKKLVFPLLLVAVVLAGCDQQGSSKDQLFEKKQDCFSYKETIEKNIGSKKLRELFYSPTKSTCIYEVESLQQDGHMKYELYDYFAGTSLYCSSVGNNCISNTEMQDYLQKIKELKGE